jgi:hypothetical protein
VSNDRKLRVVSERDDELVYHEAEDSQLSSTSVVQLDGALGKLLLFVEGVPAKVNVSVAEVTNKLVSGSWDILHHSTLKDSDESNQLDKSSSRNGVRTEQSGNTVGVGVEGVTRVVDVSWKMDSGTGGDLSEERKHADAAVLELDVTKAVESLLALTVELSERIVESERSLGTELVLERHGDSGGLGCLLSRGEGSSRGEKGGDDDRLHVDSTRTEFMITTGTEEKTKRNQSPPVSVVQPIEMQGRNLSKRPP